MTANESKMLRMGDRVVCVLDGAQGTVVSAWRGCQKVGIKWDDCEAEQYYCHAFLIHVEPCTTPLWETRRATA